MAQLPTFGCHFCLRWHLINTKFIQSFLLFQVYTVRIEFTSAICYSTLICFEFNFSKITKTVRQMHVSDKKVTDWLSKLKEKIHTKMEC